ncbi:MAG: complex I NDUFA9 subunit family protein [Gammaproteobacteria bacterium]|nr:complex I NDUFA9 subunit family protein [Gammaproteobacteria bacterium]
MRAKKITILGGSGFLGSHLVTHLAAQGHRITVLTRYREDSRHLLVIPQATIVQTNVHNERELAAQLAGADVVVNLIGILNEKGRKGLGFDKVHVQLVNKILAACNTHGIRKFVHMSALKADAGDGPSYYLQSKGRAEDAIRGNKNPDLAWSILQPSVIFGPDDSFINKFADLLKLPSPVFPLPRANARFAPVYVGDVIKAISRCITDTGTDNKVYQLCGPQVYSLREILQLVCDHTGLRRNIVGVPDSLARMQAAFMDFVPGKPFSTDNFKSLTVHSICDKDGFSRLDIKPEALTAVLPKYLGTVDVRRRYSKMREHAGR